MLTPLCYVGGASPLAVFLWTFVSCLVAIVVVLNHDTFAALIHVTDLFWGKLGLPADSGTYGVVILNPYCGDADVFRMNTPLSIFQACRILSSSGLEKDVLE